MSEFTTPIFRPTAANHWILISPGHKNPGWSTYIAGRLPGKNATAAFSHAKNDALFRYILTLPSLIKECRELGRVLDASKAWSADDEESSKEDGFGRGNQFRQTAIEEEVVQELKDAGVEGFSERASWSLRAVEVRGPFVIMIDEGGHEWVEEVEDRRQITL